MFIKNGHGYYDSNGQQHSGRGQYLALFSWNDYKAADEIRMACETCRRLKSARDAATGSPEWVERCAGYEMPDRCDTHTGVHSGIEEPRYPNGNSRLWATVRVCALSQLGHFMMGTIRIGGKSITVSGSIGNDGLPLDVQEVPANWRDKLVQVPQDVASAYWTDNGHNDIGSARDPLRQWARETFK